MKTFYDVLGVDRHASVTDIKQSYYHSLNQQFAGNPDRPWRKKDQQRLRQIRRAYLTLSSPERRRGYDLYLVRIERKRLHMAERLGTVLSVILLVAGLALIGRGYNHFQRQTLPAVSEQRPDTALAARNASAPSSVMKTAN